MSNKDLERNRPANKGERNDPNVRDADARQPGVSTMSSSDSDEGNQQLTKTSADNFREDGEGDELADKRFDE